MASTRSDLPRSSRAARGRRRRRRRKLCAMSKLWKATLGALGTIILIAIGDYVGWLLTGTSPIKIAAALWSPFGAALAWFGAPARLTHWDVLLIVLALIGFGCFLLAALRLVNNDAMSNIRNHERRLKEIEGRSSRETSREPEVPRKIDAEAVERDISELGRKALLVLLQRDGQYTDASRLLAMISAADGIDRPLGRALLSSDMEKAARLSMVLIDQIHGYCLTPEGRNWMLERFTQQEREAAKTPRFSHLRGG